MITKKKAQQLVKQLELIKENNAAIAANKNALEVYKANAQIYVSGIKTCEKNLHDLKKRKQYLDRGYSVIVNEAPQHRQYKAIIAEKWMH